MAEDHPKTPASDDASTGGSIDARRRHRGVQYDTTDISLRGVIVVLVGIAAVFVGLATAARWALESQAPANAPPGAATTYRMPTEPLPAGPQIEELNLLTGDVAANVFDAQLAQEKELDSYGPTPEDGYVHIPIDEAMKLEAAKLPAQSQQPPQPQPPVGAKSFGLVGAGESNSGQLLQETPPWQE
jgi:hypothetical protein